MSNIDIHVTVGNRTFGFTPHEAFQVWAELGTIYDGFRPLVQVHAVDESQTMKAETETNLLIAENAVLKRLNGELEKKLHKLRCDIAEQQSDCYNAP